MSKLREQISLSSNDPSGIEEIKKVLLEDKHGECYKEIYSDFNNTSSDFQDPPGNNCLLIAIAAKKDKIAELLIYDARKKLDDKEFLDFINYRYDDPTKNSVRTDCYINTSLTLAAKHEQYGLVQKLLNEGADPNLKELGEISSIFRQWSNNGGWSDLTDNKVNCIKYSYCSYNFSHAQNIKSASNQKSTGMNR